LIPVLFGFEANKDAVEARWIVKRSQNQVDPYSPVSNVTGI
jgi:hypothetical protein